MLFYSKLHSKSFDYLHEYWPSFSPQELQNFAIAIKYGGKVSSYQREAWVLSTSSSIFLISTEQGNFYGGRQFLRSRAISTEEADFYGGGLFLRSREISAEQGNFYGGSWFLRRRLISTKEAAFYRARQFVCSRLTLVWKIRTISQRKQVFIQDAVCFKVCSSGTTGPP